MGRTAGNRDDLYAAPYSRAYTSITVAIDLTAAVTQAKQPCSELTAIAVTAGSLVYKDTTGVTVTVPLAAGAILRLRVQAIEISAATADDMIVVACWQAD